MRQQREQLMRQQQKTVKGTAKITVNETAKIMNEAGKTQMNENANPQIATGITWPTGPRGLGPWAQGPEHREIVFFGLNRVENIE